MDSKNDVTIDPKALREECLSFGLFLRVCLDLAKEQGKEVGEKEKESFVLMAAYFLYGNAISSPSASIYYSALAYEERKLEKEDGSMASFPLWGEGEESEEERYCDAFFALYALYLSEGKGKPEDFLGPILFFSGAVKEDILEALSKKKGDSHYDAFHAEIVSYPFALDIVGSASKLFDIAHGKSEA